MIIQLIFFLSLAVFIFLLARRYLPFGHSGNKAGLAVSGAAKSGLGSLLALLSKIRLPKIGRPSRGNKPAASVSTDPDHDFWKEGPAGLKHELSSHFEEGEELFRKGRHKEAEQFFLKAAANNPSDAKVYARLGLLYLEQKSYSDAIEALKMAVKLEKYNPSRHYNLALAYWGNKDTRRAIASVREAISLDPVTQKYRKLLEELLNG